jgi:ABC-type Fe3+/spermidine/putrescine transport system ATPase subunit
MSQGLMLEIKHLYKDFFDTHATSDVSLTIEQGEFFALLGPSGCGKTTLLRMIAGIESPTSGEIWFDGRRVDVLAPHERQFNMVFQKYALFPHLSVIENVAFGLKVKKVPSAEIPGRVKEALDLVQMSHLSYRDVTTLSGGQQQRVALARALVNRPKVLLLDEPLSALDLKLRLQMQTELMRIQRKLNITFIFVTHDQDEAMSLSDRIAVMNRGQIEQVGKPKDIYERPNSAFVAEFIGSVNTIPQSLQFSNVPGALAAEKNPFLVRPEKLKLTRSEVPAGIQGHRFPVIIQEVIFMGPITQFIVAPASAPDIRYSAVAPNGVGNNFEAWDHGDRATAFFAAEDGYQLEP